MLKIAMREAGKVRLLDLKGRISCDVTPQLKDAVGRLLSEGHARIVFNMKDVEWIDSSGVGEMVACHLRAKRLQGAIKLALLQKSVFDILIILGLVRVFEIYDTEVEAVGSF